MILSVKIEVYKCEKLEVLHVFLKIYTRCLAFSISKTPLKIKLFMFCFLKNCDVSVRWK